MTKQWRVVGCCTRENPPGDDEYGIGVWISADEAPVGLASVAGAVRTLLVSAAKRTDESFVIDPGALLVPYGLKERHYIEMFRIRPDNVEVPAAWDTAFPRIVARGRMRLIIAGSRRFSDYAFMAERLNLLCARFDPQRILGISGGARGADLNGERWCAERGIECVRYEAHWDWCDAPRALLADHKGRPYNQRAGLDRNAKMAVSGTHLAAFVAGQTLTAGTASMVRLASGAGLKVRVSSPSGKVAIPR